MDSAYSRMKGKVNAFGEPGRDPGGVGRVVEDADAVGHVHLLLQRELEEVAPEDVDVGEHHAMIIQKIVAKKHQIKKLNLKSK